MNQLMLEKVVNETINQFFASDKNGEQLLGEIPIAVSARHIHLKQEHVEQLFGKGANLTVRKDLTQPGQFAANETLIVVGPRGSITNVRVLGPARALTQVEISHTDAIALGITPPIRESGNIEGSASCTLVGPKGSIFLQEGVIIAQSHIHMSNEDANRLNVQDEEYVSIRVNSIRPIVFEKVKIRVEKHYVLEMHIDTDEANAGSIQTSATGILVKNGDISLNTANSKKAEGKYINKKVITENDVLTNNEHTLVVTKNAIFTALAQEALLTSGKQVQYKEG